MQKIPWTEIARDVMPMDGGGEGGVYLCSWRGRQVILKVNEHEWRARQSLGNVTGIMPAMAYVDTPEGPGIIMPVAQKKVEPRMKPEPLFRLFHALVNLHEKGWIHGDVHPGNVLMLEGEVVLSDLGLATPIGDRVHGRPPARYASLWQLREEQAHPRMDLYSWALMAAYLMTGKVHWQGLMEPAVILQKERSCVPPEHPYLAGYVREIPDGVDGSWATGVIEAIQRHMDSRMLGD